jgi:hypothetical protein
MANADKRLKTLLVSLIWAINSALMMSNEFDFEQAWLVAILSGSLVFSALSLIEENVWHDLNIIILGSTGAGLMLIFFCAHPAFPTL